MTKTEYQKIQDMLSNAQIINAYQHGCRTGKRKEGWDETFKVMKSLLHNYAHDKYYIIDHRSYREKAGIN